MVTKHPYGTDVHQTILDVLFGDLSACITRWIEVYAVANLKVTYQAARDVLEDSQRRLRVESLVGIQGCSAADSLKRVSPLQLLHLEADLQCLLHPRCVMNPVIGVRALMEGLSSLTRLQFLQLGMAGCNIGDRGACALALVLPCSLTTLKLDFTDCQIGPRGCVAIAAGLPKELLHLQLVLCHCPIGVKGAQSVAEVLPTLGCTHGGLKSLHLDLDNTGIESNGVTALAHAFPQSLRNLYLDLARCHIGRHGGGVVAKFLPQGLSTLHLELSSCEIGAEAAFLLAQRLPRNLVALHLGLHHCGLGAGGARALAAKLPHLAPRLASLGLDFAGCGVGADGANALAYALFALSLLGQGLAKLTLGLAGCAIGGEATRALVAALPDSLLLLQLGLSGCEIDEAIREKVISPRIQDFERAGVKVMVRY